MREKQTGRSTVWNQELSESSMQGKLILTFRVKNFVQIFWENVFNFSQIMIMQFNSFIFENQLLSRFLRVFLSEQQNKKEKCS
jgi:hypothetical protein